MLNTWGSYNVVCYNFFLLVHAYVMQLQDYDAFRPLEANLNTERSGHFFNFWVSENSSLINSQHVLVTV